MDKTYNQALIKEIKTINMEVNLMEVCGTHTMAIARSGLRNLLPPGIKLLSGPGCPVCVTAQGDIDAVIDLVRQPEVVLATFGDMIRVPGTSSSLQDERSRGADIRVVYSPLDALNLARQYPEKEIVFLGIGFETTAPTVAVAVEIAAAEGLSNFSVLSLHKVVPPALDVIFSDPEMAVDGLICPGHVAAVTGLKPYADVAHRYHKPCVITGFETRDLLEGIYMLLKQMQAGEARGEIQYRRVVKPEGNQVAWDAMNRVFEPTACRWRGLGLIPDSGLALRPAYRDWDAGYKWDLEEHEDKVIKGCACGEVLKGKITPHQCALFGRVCTPMAPVGPCMVSQEGACAAYYRYIPKDSN
jgi:hydrogenase expression/formation protein HypD